MQVFVRRRGVHAFIQIPFGCVYLTRVGSPGPYYLASRTGEIAIFGLGAGYLQKVPGLAARVLGPDLTGAQGPQAGGYPKLSAS